MNGDRLIRVSTAATAIGIAGVAAVVSYRHAFDVVTDYGEPRSTAALVPLCVDGLVFAAGMVHLDSARRGQKAGRLAWLALALGIGATIAVNVLHGIKAGAIGAVVAAWPAVTLVLVVELLMGMIRRSRGAAPDTTQGDADRDAQHATEGDAESDMPRAVVADAADDMAADDATTRRDIEGDADHDTGRDAVGDRAADAPRAIEAPKTTTRRRTARKTSRDTGRDMSDADRAAAARAVLADEPDISGAELGRRLGLSPRQGQRLKGDIAAAPIPGQTALAAPDDTTQGDADRDAADDATADETNDHGARLLAVVGGEQ